VKKTRVNEIKQNDRLTKDYYDRKKMEALSFSFVLET
jgi:hypothetical protein